PIGNDGALSYTPGQTYVNQYLQVQRWAWGAADVPYAAQHAFSTAGKIPWHKRYLRFWYFFDNHIMWSTQWFFITLGGLIPSLYGKFTAGENALTPWWFSVQEWMNISFLPGWLADRVTIPALILTPCLLFYLIIIVTDARLRPPAPTSMSKTKQRLNYVW